MSGSELLRSARLASGLSQAELAARAATSRPTLSAYEHGRKSPSLDTFERLVGSAGFDVHLRARVAFSAVVGPRGRYVNVPDQLWRLDPEQALREVELPISLNWSQPGRRFRLMDRTDRARLYEIVLREGAPEDMLRYVDGVLLVDLWDELVLPRHVRAAWDPLMLRTIGEAVGVAS